MHSRILRTEEELESILERSFLISNDFIYYKGTFLPAEYLKYIEDKMTKADFNQFISK